MSGASFEHRKRFAVRLPGYEDLVAISRRQRWDPDAIELREDRPAWDQVAPGERAELAALLATFLIGESAVARDIAPFAGAATAPGMEACFEAQAIEEKRHERFFFRVHTEVLDEQPGAILVRARPRVPVALLELLEHQLGDVTGELISTPSKLPDAVALYHGMVEGVVFLAGQAELVARLGGYDGLSGLREGIERVQRDERWHIALGARLLADTTAMIDPSAQLSTGRHSLSAWGTLVRPEIQAHTLAVLERRLRAVGVLAAT